MTPNPATAPVAEEAQVGWVRFGATVVARVYLTVLCSLGILALLPTLMGFSGSVVQSGSMEPNVTAGDVVLSTPLADTMPLPIGGVVDFRVDDRTVMHRIVTVNDDNTIVTAGDANPQVDPWSITRADISGEARLLVPFVGLPGFWLSHGDTAPLAGWIALTLAAIILALPPATRRRASHRAPTPQQPLRPVAVAAALVVVVVAVTLVAPSTPVDAAFSATTRSTASWSAKAYSPIAPGGMGEHGAIAATQILDTSTTTYQSSVVGDVAVTPGTSVVGFRNEDIDTVHANNQAAKAAMAAAQNTYFAVAERPTTRTIPAALGGTLGGGVYASSTGPFSVATTLTLDAKGDPSARFVFKASSTITMAQRARIVLVNGAQASNVWWIAVSSATIGARSSGTPDTVVVGTFFVAGNILLQGVELSGRAISFSGGVALNGRIIPPL